MLELQCSPEDVSHDSEEGEAPFLRFRDMVVQIFTKSRKLQGLPSERRRALGNALHTASSMHQIHEIALTALSASVLFDETSRGTIANDILDRKYHLLLLPDRFDCEDQSCNSPDRPHQSVETVKGEEDALECPICLGTNNVNSRTSCNHLFCRTCISEWVASHDSCPTCRAALTMSGVHNFPS